MVKLVFVIRRLPHLTRREFQRYWLEKHGPLARRLLPLLGAKRYVQSHTLETPFDDLLRQSRGGGEPYDGLVEVWFDSLQDLESAFGTAEGARASEELLSDERRFIDLSRSSLWFAEEHTLLPQEEKLG